MTTLSSMLEVQAILGIVFSFDQQDKIISAITLFYLNGLWPRTKNWNSF